MKPIGLKVQFEGEVTVLVPEHLCHKDARLLARNVALARILVAANNPNPPDGLASFDYALDCSPAAQKTCQADWAAAKIEEISDGQVTIPDATPNYTDEGILLDDGSILEWPDLYDGTISRTDKNGFVEEVRGPGDEGYREWYDLFGGCNCFFLGQHVHVDDEGDGEISELGNDEDGWWVSMDGYGVLAEAEKITPLWDAE